MLNDAVFNSDTTLGIRSGESGLVQVPQELAIPRDQVRLAIWITMNRCPVCQEEQHADSTAFNHHVNAHFAEGGAGSSRSVGSGPAQNLAVRWASLAHE